MEPVIITDNKEWSSIDIFLFSNGQQYSPPRKYHLRSEELQWWGATINYLGRTHYGAGHSSIELYTIDGIKIDGPLELTNGAAYVAVEPPDSFVNTGYEEYLLRASRSWEKRLAQKSYNTQTLNQDIKVDKNLTGQSKTDGLNLPENNDETVSLIVASNTIISPPKTKPPQRIPRKSIVAPKQIQKRKSFDTQGAMLKKICAETDKVLPCPRKTSIKKSGCANQKSSSIVPRKLNDSSRFEQSSCCKKRASLKTEFDTKPEVRKSWDTYDTPPVRQPQVIDLFNNEENDFVSVKNDDNSLNHQRQNNLTEESVPILDKIKTDNDDNIKNYSSNKLKQINEEDKQSDILPQNRYQKNEIENELEENNDVINSNKENKSYDTNLNHRSEKQVIDEYVAQMNKGGLLLLKLKVKLKDCKTILNRDKSKNIPAAASLSNLSKTEKTSQVDINISFSGELLKSNDQEYTQNKSLQSLLTKLYTEESDQINSRKPRIIIWQCSCRDYSVNHKCCMCDTPHDCEFECKKCDASLNQKLNQTFPSCGCKNECLRNSKDEFAMNTDLTTKSPNDDRPSLSNSNGTRVKDLAQMFESSNRTILNDQEKYNNIKRNSNDLSNENQRQSVLLKKLNGSAVLDRITQNQIREGNYDSNSKSICNQSTQTDWSNVLLEARIHEDDNYTFHLPSLYILKQYNL